MDNYTVDSDGYVTSCDFVHTINDLDYLSGLKVVENTPNSGFFVGKSIQKFINQVDSLSTKEDRAKLIGKLYKFLYNNYWFLEKYPSFKKTVGLKIIDLCKQSDEYRQYYGNYFWLVKERIGN